jgi:hypothetical protein
MPTSFELALLVVSLLAALLPALSFATQAIVSRVHPLVICINDVGKAKALF